MLVGQNIEHIGPVTIALAIGLGAAGCLAWVVWRGEPFTWQEQGSPHVAFDYILLLGALLVAADLAYVEVQFSPLGQNWPWHLLIVALFMLVLAFRYDSRMLLSVALTTPAAWRGVNIPTVRLASWESWGDIEVQVNAVICGAVFIVFGWVLKRAGRKAHFEPVAIHLGWALVLLALLAGLIVYGDDAAPALLLVPMAVGVALAVWAFRNSRTALAVMGTLEGYIALTWLVLSAIDVHLYGTLGWFVLSAAGMLALAAYLHREVRGQR